MPILTYRFSEQAACDAAEAETRVRLLTRLHEQVERLRAFDPFADVETCEVRRRGDLLVSWLVVAADARLLERFLAAEPGRDKPPA